MAYIYLIEEVQAIGQDKHTSAFFHIRFILRRYLTYNTFEYYKKMRARKGSHFHYFVKLMCYYFAGAIITRRFN